MHHLRNKKYVTSLLIGIALLGASLVVNSYAVVYANKSISNSVTDIVLSNTQVYNVDGIFVYGAVLLVVVMIVVSAMRPERIPFVLKSIALFTLTRSFFLSLTHISPYPAHIAISANIFTAWFPSVFTGDDLFFSGHVGLPFLMALIFWEYRVPRILFTVFSLVFGAVVLLGHIHYSIDVVAAFYITFTIFVMAKYIFKTDWERV